MDVVVGVDLGTQGVRVIAADEKGAEVTGAKRTIRRPCISERPGYSEQDPAEWREVFLDALRETVSRLPSAASVRAVCVDSTSGTILCVDAGGTPLCRALLHNDVRSHEEAEYINGFREGFKATFALPKILWLRRNRRDLLEKTERYVHAADYLVGLLTGDFSKSDISNVMKCGYDLLEDRWPAFIERELEIPLRMLPEVRKPGEKIGEVNAGAAAETGLPKGTAVVAGATDSTAAFFASGAKKPGDWSSTLGTTLSLKGISEQQVVDPMGVIYNHRHPEGYWLPGGASNVGGECLRVMFGENLEALDNVALERFPTDLVVYPLVRKGERLPFVNPNARGFIHGSVQDRADLYAGYLEGVANVERWVFERLAGMGLEVGETVYASGGGAKSLVWLGIRATVLGKRLARPQTVEAAMGGAVLAASHSMYSSISEAAGAMVQIKTVVRPTPGHQAACDEKYGRFREECARRGYA